METLHVTRPVTIGEVTLIPIERTELQSGKGYAGFWLNGVKEIYTLVVCDKKGIHTQNAGPADIKLDELLQKIPALKQILAKL